MMGNWKKITAKAKLDNKVVILMTDGKHPQDGYWDAFWDDSKGEWNFMDSNCVKAEDWIGKPTHYKLVNE